MADVVDQMDRFKRHPDTAVIEKLLRDCEVGGVITYEMLDTALHRDYRQTCLSYGQSARRMLEKDGVYFRAVPNVGYQRLSESEKITFAADRKHRAGRKRLREGLRIVQRTDYSKLTGDERTIAMTMSAQMQSAEMLTSSRAAKKIEMAVSDKQQALPIGRVLEMFQK